MNQFTILIVDDDPDDHFFIKSAIAEFGLRIDLVSMFDGKQGLKYLELVGSGSANEKLPHVILCDINMPFIDGLRFLESVKSDGRFKHIPVCMLSTNCDDEVKKKVLSLGALDCISKPSYASNYNTILAGIFNKVAAFEKLY